MVLIIFQTENIANQTDSDCGKEFEKYTFVCHLYAMRCAFADISSLETLVVKVLVALLRYTDIIPADKAYYEAGIAARVRIHLKSKFVRLYQLVTLRLQLVTKSVTSALESLMMALAINTIYL